MVFGDWWFGKVEEDVVLACFGCTCIFELRKRNVSGKGMGMKVVGGNGTTLCSMDIRLY